MKTTECIFFRRKTLNSAIVCVYKFVFSIEYFREFLRKKNHRKIANGIFRINCEIWLKFTDLWCRHKPEKYKISANIFHAYGKRLKIVKYDRNSSVFLNILLIFVIMEPAKDEQPKKDVKLVQTVEGRSKVINQKLNEYQRQCKSPTKMVSFVDLFGFLSFLIVFLIVFALLFALLWG